MFPLAPRSIANTGRRALISKVPRPRIRLQVRRFLNFNGVVKNNANKIPPTAVFGTSDAANDDKTLREIFDSRDAWRSFSSFTSTKPVGLFCNNELKSAEGFIRYAHRCISKAQAIVDQISNAYTPEELKTVVKKLDRLSDLLCRVIDMSDFVRASTNDANIEVAATQAYTMTYEYMNVLNTTSGLHDALSRAYACKEVVEGWSEEEAAVARILLKDFVKSGVYLDGNSKAQFVSLSNDIAQLGTEFMSEPEPAVPYLRFPSSKLMGMDPQFARQLTVNGTITFPTDNRLVNHALRTVRDESVREQLYRAVHTSHPRQIERLECMLKKRGQLAKLVGYRDFGHMTLNDKMAGSKEAVRSFLYSIAEANEHGAKKELHRLMSLKKQFGSDSPFRQWDRDFYGAVYTQTEVRDDQLWRLAEYFSLGTVIQGLSRLMSHLYGIRLVPRPTAPGETWNSDVRRLDVVSETEGHIAVIYCDLFEKRAKSNNPTHFTIRCSRKIDENEVFDEEGKPEDDGMASARRPDGTLYQLPTIALVCDFSQGGSNRPPLLSFREVQTLFHEMGHAIHSMLGRTEYQNVAGTRCVTDFAEFPSILMEYFAKSPQVLQLFARHYRSDEPLPMALMEQQLKKDSLFEASETRSQIILAMLDQALHSDAVYDTHFNSTKTYNEVEKQLSLLPPVEGTSWQGFFGHLYGYGATYFSYLFDRAIAAKVYHSIFESDPVSREAGEKLKDEVLKWGGGRDPWKSLAGVLGNDKLAEGGERAMEEVGHWGSQLK